MKLWEQIKGQDCCIFMHSQAVIKLENFVGSLSGPAGKYIHLLTKTSLASSKGLVIMKMIQGIQVARNFVIITELYFKQLPKKYLTLA